MPEEVTVEEPTLNISLYTELALEFHDKKKLPKKRIECACF